MLLQCLWDAQMKLTVGHWTRLRKQPTSCLAPNLNVNLPVRSPVMFDSASMNDGQLELQRTA
jgi:hypothetical protein